jgi:hypothetical protein
MCEQNELLTVLVGTIGYGAVIIPIFTMIGSDIYQSMIAHHHFKGRYELHDVLDSQ